MQDKQNTHWLCFVQEFNTAVHVAVRQGHEEALDVLLALQLPPNVTLQNLQQKTPLHLAAVTSR